MSAEIRNKPAKPAAPSDIFTVLVIASFFAVIASSVFVAVKCYNLFGSLFSIQ